MVIFGSGIGLTSNRCQANTWAKIDPQLSCCICSIHHDNRWHHYLIIFHKVRQWVQSDTYSFMTSLFKLFQLGYSAQAMYFVHFVFDYDHSSIDPSVVDFFYHFSIAWHEMRGWHGPYTDHHWYTQALFQWLNLWLEFAPHVRHQRSCQQELGHQA